MPVTRRHKAEAFAEMAPLFDEARGDVMVLARYMQILPPEVCARYPGRIINIHHSFLPSFAGARPYHQAFERGVKLIGATCHYVTAELDGGPDHRAGHQPDRPRRHGRGSDADRAGTSSARCWPGDCGGTSRTGS